MLLIKTVSNYIKLTASTVRLRGGEGGIRPHDTLARIPDFESGAFNRALPPLRLHQTCYPSNHNKTIIKKYQTEKRWGTKKPFQSMPTT